MEHDTQLKNGGETESRYIESCRKEFWQKVFRFEIKYLTKRLEGCHDVLSVGCGPAIIEGELVDRGFHITGLDISQEALNCAPDKLRTVAARAEDMPFREGSFDAVIYVASFQFIEDYRSALAKSAFVLRSNGKILILLLNPASLFFKERSRNPDSYVSKIKHTDLKTIEDAVAKHFRVHAEYYLRINGNDILETGDEEDAALYIIRGTKRTSNQAMAVGD